MARFHLFFSSYRAAPSKPLEGAGEESDEFGPDGPITSPLILPGSAAGERGHHHHQNLNPNPFSVLEVVVTALRNSMVMCTVGAVPDDDLALSSSSSIPSSPDISSPTEVRHVTHVTFDRFDGFFGLPADMLPEIPSKAPSASVTVFGVSAKSMQCSYDNKGNSVPTILLSMQSYLYSQGGLQVEGIFRINAENSQELYVRDQLNKGVVLHGVDLHCLAGLIKAWFRELPTGVLDSLTPDQVMQCNTEEECFQLARTLPPTEAALLDWAINLMADVAENENHNKMNARNIAMVFAPNMTQMADPLTALIHAVQVMNLLKTLITKKLKEREQGSANAMAFQSCSESLGGKDGSDPSGTSEVSTDFDLCALNKAAFSKFLFCAAHPLEIDIE